MTDAPLLETGSTCWRIETTERMAVIVDGADYFRAVKQAMLNATREILMIGWDFDTRIAFEPGGATLPGPNRFGDFMAWLVDDRPEVEMHMLKWDMGMLQALSRGMLPLGLRPLRMSGNFQFRLDGEHPAGAAHHSKIIVIDDRVAFCGGIDMTVGRWDTRAHLDDQPLRGLPDAEAPAKPWHDVTTAVSGPLAVALGDLGRERWFRATGERLDPPHVDADPWPDLAPLLTDVPVAIARTYPGHGDYAETREIEALYLRAIAAARDVFYVETQYLASPAIARAMAARLAEADGPEFVVVLPRNAEGWLRREAMDGARQRLLRFLWANDPHGRFAAYHPVTDGGQPIYVHAKVLCVDDRLLRIGSSNLNNRSMGFDTECDVAIEAAGCPDPAAVRDIIIGLRDDLLAEHLGVTPGQVAEAIAAGGLVGAIESLRGDGKTLSPFTREKISDEDSVLAENEFADPEGLEGGLAERLRAGVQSLLDRAGG